ncbi:isochorismatase family protein [Sphingomonas sp.]|uniref:isochorismatase family protein n=1 Tax=Sphingomonas sp. TaxID=28214 RepID=UPI00286CD92D|nr:isochorismatase family protein [Sphingomonas sp.]
MTIGSDRTEAGAFDGHLTPGERPALLIVDMVMAYLKPGSPLFLGGEEAVKVTARLAALARSAGNPVVFTNVLYQSNGRDGGLFYRKVPGLRAFDQGSDLGDFPPGLVSNPNDMVFTKQYASAFFGTSLATMLHAEGIDTVLIAGFSTSGCVRATAVDAIQHGFAPFVVDSACADRTPEVHAANLFDLGCKYAEVIGEEDAAAILSAARG